MWCLFKGCRQNLNPQWLFNYRIAPILHPNSHLCFHLFWKVNFCSFPIRSCCFFLFKQFLFRFQTPPTTTHIVAEVSQHNMVAAAGLVSRTGRHLQRYDIRGRRQVVGCIPYRYKTTNKSALDNIEELEVLVISSQKGKGMLFPKGGWETDESITEAASRETLEEAGVRGIVQSELGSWSFKSKTYDTFYEGYMFPLLVKEQLEFWPEKNFRQRVWMSAHEAREVCQHWWMKEALDALVGRLSSQKKQQIEEVMPCSLS